MVDFESSKKEIAELVEAFAENEHYYKSNEFDEENAKVKFISKFFKILGWDVDNEENRAPQYADVEFEDSIKISGKTKSPDYCFRYWGERKFFVEAKAPHENIDKNRDHAFQLKRYTWSAKLPLGILTDFEEFAVYEPKVVPKKHQNTTIDRIKYYNYKDYVENWEEIYNLFSREAVKKGKYDNFVDNVHGDRKGTETVDDEFLKTIENWRLELARNIANRNKDLTIDELNYAVQLIIDRLIFLRIAEDRGIESYGKLKKITIFDEDDEEKLTIYEKFIDLCKKADAKYNSGLFHFSKEKNDDLTVDIITPKLIVDDGKLKKIINELYYPDCPYEFSMISTEILGNIYEQFLGKIIRLTDRHLAKVEDKPEVKKAGGVFYTPNYIVEYIVENTVGELLKGKTPNKVSDLRIVDPACGSGSFLLGAYQKLLDWHLKYYDNMDNPPKNVIYEDKNGIIRLTIQEKKRILLNNIYGVDIDSQAVEVTKLSLLLKVLENENKDIFEAQQKLIQERALPDLGSNIKCGNSLISTDILNQQELNNEEIFKINPFDWEEEFSEVFKNGGFDVVIGNPPYFNIDTWGTNSKRKDYIKKNYKDVWADKTDILFYFINKANEISKNKVGFIISNAFLFAKKAEKLRNYLLDNTNIKTIVNFEKYMVFKSASITTSIIVLDKTLKTKKTNAIGLESKYYSEKDLLNIINDKNNYFKIKLEKNDVFPIKTNEIRKLNKKIDYNKPKLKELFHIGKGMETGRNTIYSFKEKPNFPDELLKLRISTKDCKKYYLNENSGDYVLFIENFENFDDLPPIIKDYLKKNKKELMKRGTVKNEGHCWWKFNRALHKEFYNKQRIFTNYRNTTNEFALDENKKFIGFTNTTVIFDTNSELNIKYLLSLLNSKVLSFRYQSIGKQTGEGSYEYFENGISKLPIPKISLDEQQQFVDLADKMIELNKEISFCNTPNEKKLLNIQINKTNEKIDDLVYELYGLSDEEIEIIEENIGIDD